MIAASGMGPANAAPAACEPTFRALGSGPILTKLGTAAWSLEAAVIGCRAKLSGLSETDTELLAGVIRTQLREQDLRFIRFRDEALRRDVAAAMNRALGGELVADVFFFNVARAENVDGTD
jgi:hypothetical protein